MSYVEIFKFDKAGNSESYADIENSYRGAMAIWNFLGKKYCGHGASMFDFEPMKEIWNLVDDKKVLLDERIVLFTTLDKSLIRKEDIPRVVQAFRNFMGDTSLNEQADILEEIEKEEDCIAVGWHQNSASCEQWFDYNCLEEDEHYFLFEELEDE